MGGNRKKAAMELSAYLRRIHCPECDEQAVWGPAQMLEGLQQLGMLRRETRPDPELVVHLAEDAAQRLRCPHCQHPGLQLQPWSDDFDDFPSRRACEVCGEFIPVERLEIFPNASRCAGCQDKPAPATHDDDFCPRCGDRLQVRISRGTGVARYHAACPACGWKS
jgi:predicted RNA-binding Zn-ribbon protein involved in translation (DUF1610 family)